MSVMSRFRDPELAVSRLEPRQEVTHLLAGLMEAMWIAPWFAIILPQAGRLSPLTQMAFVAGNLLLALILVRVLDSRGMYEGLRQFAFLCALTAAILLSTGTLLAPLPQTSALQIISDNVSPLESITLPPILGVILVLAVVWWRGLRLGIVMPTPTRIAFAMRLGILFYLVAAFFPNAQTTLIASLPLFFFFGLLGNSLARAISLREAGGQVVTFGGRWAGFMTLAAGVITLIGFGIAAGLIGMDPSFLANLIQPILTAVIYVFAIVMTPVLLVVEAIVEALINAMVGGQVNEIMEPAIGNTLPQGPPQTNGLEEALQQLRRFFDLFGGLGTCITVAIVLVIIVVVIMTLRRRQRAEMVDAEVREDLDGDALGGLRNLFRRGLGAMGQAFRTVGQFGLGRDLFAALTVRRAYAQMVRLASRQGYPRAVSQTPYEYRRVLQEAFPAVQAEVSTLTEAYVRVHYGEVPESADALRAVTTALERFKAMPSGE